MSSAPLGLTPGRAGAFDQAMAWAGSFQPPAPRRTWGRTQENVCVDLDGTLLATDHLHELLIAILKRRPLALFALLLALFRGKAHFKRKAVEMGAIDVALLPFRAEVLDYLHARRAEGARLYLVTAADARIAEAVAEHLGIFSGVFASDGRTNLAGAYKAERLTKEFGLGRFSYIGNCRVDLPVWEAAGEAVVVSPSPRLLAQARALAGSGHALAAVPGFWRHAWRALRPHQWLKNLILLVPLVTSHQLAHADFLLSIALAGAAFCATASAIYIINDLADLESDRRHPRKKARPFAAGALPIAAAPFLVVTLLSAAAVLCAWLPGRFAAVLALYVAITSLYSFWLKREVLVDVFVLAALYSIRLVAGHAATGIAYSVWLFMFSMFIFLSLALLKRAAEVWPKRQAADADHALVAGRGYRVGDLEQLVILGSGCGLMAVLVMALYVTSPDVRALYTHPALLLLACPLVLYWISRIWLAAHRGEMHDDPVVFAMKDRASYIVAAGIALVLVAARFGHLLPLG